MSQNNFKVNKGVGTSYTNKKSLVIKYQGFCCCEGGRIELPTFGLWVDPS